MSVNEDFDNRPWVGVDFDGTLVEHAYPEIGRPVRPVLDFVKALREKGLCVRIMTARVGPHGRRYRDGTPIDPDFVEKQVVLLEAWCMEHLGEILPITASKDFCMVALVDDRALQVVPNKGVCIDGRSLIQAFLEG